MPTYERVQDGRVVETVVLVEGSYEDTRIGVQILDGNSEWRTAGAAESAPDDAGDDEDDDHADVGDQSTTTGAATNASGRRRAQRHGDA